MIQPLHSLSFSLILFPFLCISSAYFLWLSPFRGYVWYLSSNKYKNWIYLFILIDELGSFYICSCVIHFLLCSGIYQYFIHLQVFFTYFVILVFINGCTNKQAQAQAKAQANKTVNSSCIHQWMFYTTFNNALSIHDSCFHKWMHHNDTITSRAFVHLYHLQFQYFIKPALDTWLCMVYCVQKSIEIGCCIYTIVDDCGR